MRRVILFLVLMSALFSLPAFAKRLTRGFRLAKMQLDFPFHPEWETDLSPAAKELLKQPYTFMGKGAQSYVFVSEDGKTVIKLFRYDHPSHEQKIVHLFSACKMAYDHLREETGLIAIHLNTSQQELPILHCKDALGRPYQLPLDHYRFALQKKAKAFSTALEEAHKSPIAMKKRIDEFLSLLQTRTEKEILNSDPNVSRNFGFLEDRAIEFDFGNYRLSPGLNRTAEMHRYTNKLRGWLGKNAPEWVAYFDHRLEAHE